MLDRFLKLIVTLTLALFLVQAVIGVVVRALEGALSGILKALGTTGGFFSQLLVAAVVLSFLIGLLIRGLQFLTARDPRAARERATRNRAMRQRVRRPAEGVPPLGDRNDQLRDPDPAINEGRKSL